MASISGVTMTIALTDDRDYELTVNGNLKLTAQEVSIIGNHGGVVKLQTHVMDADTVFNDHVYKKSAFDEWAGPFILGNNSFAIDPFVVPRGTVTAADPYPEENAELYVSVRVYKHENGTIGTKWAHSSVQNVKVRSFP